MPATAPRYLEGSLNRECAPERKLVVRNREGQRGVSTRWLSMGFSGRCIAIIRLPGTDQYDESGGFLDGVGLIGRLA